MATTAQQQVKTVLVNTGNQNVLAAGNAPTALATGQIGIFNENSVSRSTATAVAGEKFFLATKLPSGKIVRSRGLISTNNVRSVKVQCYTAPVQQVIDITGICAECDSDYSVKIDINHPVAWHTYGYSPFTKTFTTKTACCSGDGTGDCTALVRELRDLINGDAEALFTATARNPNDSTELNDAALDTWDATADGCPNLRIAVNAFAEPNFNNVPYKHVYPELVTINKVTTQGFSCCSATTVSEVTAPVIAQGDGSMVRYEEYENGGIVDNPGPYRVTTDGVVLDTEFNGVASTTYVALTIEYNDPVYYNFQTYTQPMMLTVYIPVGADNTKDNLGDIIDDLIGTDTDTALTACA